MHKNKILICAATKYEVNIICEYLGKASFSNNLFSRYIIKNFTVDIAILGVGQIFTSYNLCKIFNAETYALAINTGICGSFNSEIKIGETLEIISDQFADLGISSENNFETIFESGFAKAHEFPFTDSKLLSDYNLHKKYNLQQAHAITVNNVSGEKNQIQMRQKKFMPDVESMEGAAFFYICKKENIKCAQIRSVSNYVEPRNKNNWNIPLAVENLNQNLINILNDIILL